MNLSEFIKEHSEQIAELSKKASIKVLDGCGEFIISAELEYNDSLTILKPEQYSRIRVKTYLKTTTIDMFYKKPQP
jgi:hypothetical protein